MKQIAGFFLIIFSVLTSYAQQQRKEFQCPCSKIGIDAAWADSNKVSCYLIPVNKDAATRRPGKYSIAVAVAASEYRSGEPLLYLHGGPGSATLGNLISYLRSPTWKLFREKHDLIFFDYRGTGFSEPSLCNYLQDSVFAFNSSNPSPAAKAAKKISLYKTCKDDLLSKGIDLAGFNSHQLAADADEVRKALQINYWNIYGVSYGTTVALNSIRSFPKAIKSVILDSPYPPNAPWVDFVRPFDTCFKVLEKNILRDTVTALRFLSLRQDFVKAVKRLNNNPVEINYKRSNNTIVKYKYTGNDFAWSIWSAMLKPRSIPFVPLTITEVANGNDSILQQWSTAFNSPDAHGKFSETQSRAILCFEGKPQQQEDTEQALLIKYPEFASFNSGYPTAICNVWRPDTPAKKIFEPVVSNVPVLILSGEYDPVCPPLFGEITAKTLKNATFITVPSASHAAIHLNDCLRTIATNFILHPGTKPSADCVKNQPKIKFITEDLAGSLNASSIK